MGADFSWLGSWTLLSSIHCCLCLIIDVLWCDQLLPAPAALSFLPCWTIPVHREPINLCLLKCFCKNFFLHSNKKMNLRDFFLIHLSLWWNLFFPSLVGLKASFFPLCVYLCSQGLALLTCFSLYLTWNLFISPSILQVNLAGCSHLGWQFLNLISEMYHAMVSWL